jgi:hypothetical protein
MIGVDRQHLRRPSSSPARATVACALRAPPPAPDASRAAAFPRRVPGIAWRRLSEVTMRLPAVFLLSLPRRLRALSAARRDGPGTATPPPAPADRRADRPGGRQHPDPGPALAPLRLGLAGLGTVGIGVVKIVQAHADLIAARAGRPVAITAVSARDRSEEPRCRPVGLCLGNRSRRAGQRADVDVFVEVMGGHEGPARRDRGRACRRQGCRHRQQGAAGPSRSGPGRRPRPRAG